MQTAFGMAIVDVGVLTLDALGTPPRAGGGGGSGGGGGGGGTSTGWTPQVNADFSSLPDGHWFVGWCKYAGFEHVFKQSYFDQSHVYIQGGLLHLVSKWDDALNNGAGAWGSAGFGIYGTASCPAGTPPYPYSASNHRITLRMRVVDNRAGAVTMGHRNVVSWPDLAGGVGNGYWLYGEEDMLESQGAFDNASMFLHYSANGVAAQEAWRYPATLDLGNWHVYRFQRLNNVVSIFIDDMVTPIHSYEGIATSETANARTWRFELQMNHPGGTPPKNADYEDWQIASILIEKSA
jgi:hypothetical protein